MSKKHKHYNYIIAWARGEGIQQKITGVQGSTWFDNKDPTWDENAEYRLKPIYDSKEIRFSISFDNLIGEEVTDGTGNCLVTYDKVNGTIVDISRLK